MWIIIDDDCIGVLCVYVLLWEFVWVVGVFIFFYLDIVEVDMVGLE